MEEETIADNGGSGSPDDKLTSACVTARRMPRGRDDAACEGGRLGPGPAVWPRVRDIRLGGRFRLGHGPGAHTSPVLPALFSAANRWALFAVYRQQATAVFAVGNVARAREGKHRSADSAPHRRWSVLTVLSPPPLFITFSPACQ